MEKSPGTSLPPLLPNVPIQLCPTTTARSGKHAPPHHALSPVPRTESGVTGGTCPAHPPDLYTAEGPRRQTSIPPRWPVGQPPSDRKDRPRRCLACSPSVQRPAPKTSYPTGLEHETR